MKKVIKRITAWLAVFALLLGFCAAASVETFAASNDFIIDSSGVLTGYTGVGGNVVIPDNVTKIGDKAFAGCSDIVTITMPDSVKTIGESAFDSCSGLTSIQFSNKLTSIGNNAFWGCKALKNITIPASVKTIGFSAFCNCDSMTGVYIPNNVTSIGNYAFGYLYYGKYEPVISFTILGESNAAARTYADKYSIPFVTKASLKITMSGVKTKNGKIVVTWKKNTKVSGYQIQYSTSSKFTSSKTKSVTVGKKNTVSKTISGVRAGKTYYVRIRGYRTISGKKYYSAWGTAKKITL